MLLFSNSIATNIHTKYHWNKLDFFILSVPQSVSTSLLGCCVLLPVCGCRAVAGDYQATELARVDVENRKSHYDHRVVVWLCVVPPTDRSTSFTFTFAPVDAGLGGSFEIPIRWHLFSGPPSRDTHKYTFTSPSPSSSLSLVTVN